MGALYQSGLLSSDIDDTARMHRLVQAVTLARLSEADHHQRTVEAVELLAGLFPLEGHRSGAMADGGAVAQPTARPCWITSRRRSSPAQQWRACLTKVGNYFWGRVRDLRRARALHEQALAMCQRLYEGDHPDVAPA